jgi:predicted metal-dependent hydrolase
MNLAKRLLPLRQYSIHASGIDAAVTHKRVRNLTISVHRSGDVRVTAPGRASPRDVERAIIARIEWIKRTRARLALQRPARIPEYVTGEAHRFRGVDHGLIVTHHSGTSQVQLRGDHVLELRVNPGSGRDERQTAVEKWYREQLNALLPDLITPWASRMGVQPVAWRVRRMRTRWGTCNTKARRIWLNLELVTVSPECLEYVVVHELAHLLEASHNERFRAIMDQFLPDWRERRSLLNSRGVARSGEAEAAGASCE